MIAPIRETEAPRRSPAIRRAYRLVAGRLLKRGAVPDDAPPVPAWKAWLFVGWVVVVTTVYFAYMLGGF